MTEDELARLKAAYVQDLNDWVAKDKAYKAVTERFLPLTMHPGPGNPMRQVEPWTPENVALMNRSSDELEEAFKSHRASRMAYVEAYQRARRSGS